MQPQVALGTAQNRLGRDETMTRGKGYRETRDVIGAIRRLTRKLGERIGNGETYGDGTEERIFFLELEEELHRLQAQAIAALRQNGTTDGQIAQWLGVTRQAVSKRWPGHGQYKGA